MKNRTNYKEFIIIEIISGPHKFQKYEFNLEDSITIGNSKQNLLCLSKDNSISKLHGIIKKVAGRIIFFNLGESITIIKRKNKKFNLDNKYYEFLEDSDEIYLGNNGTILKINLLNKEDLFEEQTSEESVLILSKPIEDIFELISKEKLSKDFYFDIVNKILIETKDIYELETFLEKICDIILKIFKKATHVTILISDPNLFKAVIKYSKSSMEKQDKNIKMSQTLVNKVMNNSEGIIFHNLPKIFANSHSIKSLNILSAMCVPLIFRKSIIGLIQVDNRKSIFSFTENDLDLLIFISYYINMILDKIMLYEEQKKIFDNMISALIYSLDLRDPQTSGHCLNVQMYALGIAEELGLDKKEKELIKYAALLHDLGKIVIEDSILKKKSSLTEEEYNKIKQHTMYTKNILEKIVIPDFLKEISIIVMYHHERFDGKGYFGLKGDNIPLASRIIAVADTFDAVRSSRYYHDTEPIRKAVKVLIDGKGKQFDEKIVDAFIKHFNLGVFIE